MKEIWNSLSRGQRVSILVLVVAVVASLGWTLAREGGSGFRTLLEISSSGDADEFRALLRRLEEGGVEWRLSTPAPGRVTVEVEAGESFQRALLMAAESRLPFDQPAGDEAGIFGGSGVLSFSADRRAREEEARVRNIEAAIRWYPNVESVRIVVHRAKTSRMLRPEGPDSAAVALRLKGHAGRLTAREATTIRKLVSAAFTIPPERVQVVDDRLNDYGSDSSSLAALEREDEVRRTIEGVVRGLYGGVFDDDEIRLGVLVDLGVGARSARADGRSSAGRAEVGASGDSSRAGLAERLSGTARVNVVLDIEAVRRVLDKRRRVLAAASPLRSGSSLKTSGGAESDGTASDGGESPTGGRDVEGSDAAAALEGARLLAAIGEYEREQEEFLTRQLPMDDARVAVRAEVFSRDEVASLDALIVDGAEPTAEEILGRWIVAVAQWPWWRQALVFGGAGLGSLSLLILLVRGRGRGVRAEPVRVVAEGLPACERLLGLKRHGEDTVRDRPEVATTILRLWLADTEANGASAAIGQLDLASAREALDFSGGSRSDSVTGGADAAPADEEADGGRLRRVAVPPTAFN